MESLSPLPSLDDGSSGALPFNGSVGAIKSVIGHAGRALSDTVRQAERLDDVAEQVRRYSAAGRAPNTRRAYDSDWRDFASWSEGLGFPAEPPIDARQVAAYLAARAGEGLTVATLERRLAAIRALHREVGAPRPESPELAAVWSGIRREHGRPAQPKQPLVVEDLRTALARLPNSLAGLRDRAVLLVGFGGALRRSELAEIRLDGGVVRVRFVAKGLEIHLDRSKADQDGRGAVVAIPRGQRIETCPSRSLRAWLDAAAITQGAVFRAVSEAGRVGEDAIAAKTVARIVKRACDGAGLDPSMFAGHSLRSGLATTAAEQGADGAVIQAHLRHAKFDTTTKYIRSADRFARNAAAKAGL